MIIGTLVVLLLLAMILVPIIFKDDIQQAIDQELDKNLNASIYYDTDAFGISLFRSFPNLSVSVGNFGIAGIEQFEEDTLLSVDEFSITVDIMSAIGGDQIKILNVSLERPVIQILVLEDGSANYDIVKSSGEVAPEETSEEESASGLSVGIRKWTISNADVIYYDSSLPFYVTLFDLNHSGSGDFTQDVFDMITSTTVSELSLGYDGDEYITDKLLTADITMAMDLANMNFRFKENRVGLNDFAIEFDGFIDMPADDITMEINYAGKDIDLRSVLSLIPGLYAGYLDGISASGSVGFDGYVKGTYNENSMPMVAANFRVNDGKLSYEEYPVPMEEITISAGFDYPSADLRESSFTMDNFSMKLDGETVTASLLFRDFEDYYWDFKLDGNADLEKITKIIPVEGVDLKGKVNATLQTRGRMSDLEAEEYQKLTTSGSMSVSDFQYSGEDLPQGFGIRSTQASFNPSEIVLSEFKGNAGRTDLNLSGKITNYLEYALSDDATLSGSFDFVSAKVDINEWMVSDETETEEEEDTSTMEVIRIPANIDFILTSDIKEILYDNLAIKDFRGELIIRDGALALNEVDFELLDGSFTMNGLYETSLPGDPTYSYDLNIKDLSIPESFKAFSTVQKLAPFAEKMDGKFSTNFQISGALAEDMSPIYETMQGSGLLEIAQASLSNVKLLTAASSVSSLDQKDGSVSLRDVLMQAEIRDGSVFIDPFDMKMAGYTTTIAGSNTIDGQLNYTMTMKEVSAGAVGDAVTSAISSLTGTKLSGSKIDINFGVGGNFTDPTVKLLGVSPAGSGDTGAKSTVTTAAKVKIDEQKEALTQQVDEKKEELKTEVLNAADQKTDEAKEQILKEADKAKAAAKDAVKGLLGGKKKKKKKGGK